MARIRSCWYVWYVWYPYVWYVICWNVRYHTLICLHGFFWYQVGEQSKDVKLMYWLFLVIINHVKKCSLFIDEFVHFPNVRTHLWYLYVPSLDQQTKDLEFQPSKHHVVCINGFGVYVLLKETLVFSHTVRIPTSQTPSSKAAVVKQQLPRPGPHRTPDSKQSGTKEIWRQRVNP